MSKVIGTFVKAGDKFVGSVKTLQLQAQLRFEPTADKENEKAPSFRVFAGDYELGAAWTNQSESGTQYLSVRLDDPSFGQPLTARLVARKEGEDFLLIWNR